MNLVDRGRIIFLEREIRTIKMRKAFPDRFQTQEPQTDFMYDAMIRKAQEKIDAIRRKVD